MKKSTSRKEELEKMLSNRDFKNLSQYKDPVVWENLESSERQILGLLFVEQGVSQLEAGDKRFEESFQLANDLVSNSVPLLLRQVTASPYISSNPRYLKFAEKTYRKILKIEPKLFQAWHGLAVCLAILGDNSSNAKKLSKALESFGTAEKFLSHNKKINPGSFYSDWGFTLYRMGKVSGEPVDFYHAIQKYQLAAEKGINYPHFWNEYGNVYFELGNLIKKSDYLVEAAELYWAAVKSDSNFYLGWSNLALSLLCLYEVNPQESYFKLGIQAFNKSTELDPENALIWLKWGELLAYRGRLTREISFLAESCLKYERADQLEPNDSTILSRWAESQMLIGVSNEDLTLLKDAEKKNLNAVEIQPDDPYLWFQFGNCLNEIGRYFSDQSYYLSATEKFKRALKLDPKNPVVWYGLAQANFAIGQMNQNVKQIEEAEKCCKKTIRYGGHSSSLFWSEWALILLTLGYLTDEKRYAAGALAKFEESFRLSSTNPNDSKSPPPDLLYHYGCAMALLADIEEDVLYCEKAIEIFHKVLECDPSYITVHINLGSILTLVGEMSGDPFWFDEAVKHFEKYITHDPEDSHVWDEWGVTLLSYAELRRDPSVPQAAKILYEKAEEKFQHAVALGNHTSLYHLACLYSLIGDVQVAIGYLERSKENRSLPKLDDLMKDEWLETVRNSSQFKHFVNNL